MRCWSFPGGHWGFRNVEKRDSQLVRSQGQCCHLMLGLVRSHRWHLPSLRMGCQL